MIILSGKHSYLCIFFLSLWKSKRKWEAFLLDVFLNEPANYQHRIWLQIDYSERPKRRKTQKQPLTVTAGNHIFWRLSSCKIGLSCWIYWLWWNGSEILANVLTLSLASFFFVCSFSFCSPYSMSNIFIAGTELFFWWVWRAPGLICSLRLCELHPSPMFAKQVD